MVVKFMNLRIKQIRENNDLTTRDVAKLLNISKTYYNYFETLEKIIPLFYLNEFCNLFHVSMDYVLGLSNINVITKQKITLNRILISKRLKQVRLMNHLTQDKLAKVAHTSQSTISSYEKGETLILTAFLFEICQKLNISVDYVTGRSNIIQIYVQKEKNKL